jgi:hypothetical protein
VMNGDRTVPQTRWWHFLGRVSEDSAITKSDSTFEFVCDLGLNPRWALIHST